MRFSRTRMIVAMTVIDEYQRENKTLQVIGRLPRASSQASYRLASLKRQESSLITLLLLSDENPLRWAFHRGSERNALASQ